MRLRLTGIRLSLESEGPDLVQAAARRLSVPDKQIENLTIVKKALDARKSDRIEFVYTVDIKIKQNKKVRLNPPFVNYAPLPVKETPAKGSAELYSPPVVVGSGPAGLFCALKLASWGYRPLILEQGMDVDRRFQEINNFWVTRNLNPRSNIQFGEGGAGTFSDGKLTTRVKDPRVRLILEQMVEAGAPEEILYLNKPHVGTDMLRVMIKNLRKRLLDQGGEIIFDARVTGIKTSGGRITAVEIEDKYILPAEIVVLAIGHSARDTYRMLSRMGIALESKAFAMGLRVEHPQEFIDRSQYGKFSGHPKLGPADYTLSYQDKRRKRGAYSFCMCPGGYVVGAASELKGVVTNGMSEYARNSKTANSALVVTVDATDFGDGSLAGMEYQRKWEETAFQTGGKDYSAPVQKMEDFLKDRNTSDLSDSVVPSYRPGVTPANVRDCLPKEVGETLAEAVKEWDKKIKGYANNRAVVTGVETRTSAPLRILRNEEMESVNTGGLYPAGEGAGYAGGIISAAVDGLKAAEHIIQKYREPEGFFPPALMTELRGEL